jgi:calcium-dependent protein kinase
MIFEDLTFIKIIGKGSFGQVYLTSRKGHSEFYATKIIKKIIADSAKVKKYFHNEINILKEIEHKNIMKLIEIKQNSENYYLICELCNGGSLRQCVNKYLKMYNKTFSEEIIQYLMKQIIEALKYLHGKHIMHRDLKLDNILVNFKDENDKSVLNMYGAEVKIIDFGFAAHVDKKQDLHKSVLGSPLYMDPKLLKKYTRTSNIDITGYDESIDIWSLGNIFYEMLTGKLAFATNDIKILEQKIDTGFYSLPTTSYKEVVGFLIGMFQYDSEKRLTAEELSKHDFLSKNIRHFVRIDINSVKNYIKNDKLVISIKEDKTLWNMFNNKYNKSLEMIPEDTEVSESVLNNIVNYKDKNNSKENEIKAKVKRAFDKMNEDFMYLPPFFIPLVPGNDPRDMYNEEKQI